MPDVPDVTISKAREKKRELEEFLTKTIKESAEIFKNNTGLDVEKISIINNFNESYTINVQHVDTIKVHCSSI